MCVIFFCVSRHVRFSLRSDRLSLHLAAVSAGPQSFLWASTGQGHVWHLSIKDGTGLQDVARGMRASLHHAGPCLAMSHNITCGP